MERNTGTCMRIIIQINLANFFDNIVSINLLFSGLNFDENAKSIIKLDSSMQN